MMEWIISASFLITVVAVFRRILRGKISLRLQYALWGIVLLRLLIPWNPVESDISILNITREPVIQSIAESVQEPIRFESSGYAVIEENGEPIPVTNTYFLADSGDINDFFSVSDILFGIWGIGCILMICFMLTSNLLFLKKISRNREAVEIDGVSLPVYVTDQVETPCLAGLFHPAIYLTSESMEPEWMRHVLEHERTHYRHGDHITAVFRCVALALHWYNPLAWWAARSSKQDGELACDEGTIARLGEEERLNYGRTLLNMTCVSGRNDVMLTATTMKTGKRRLRERIMLIAKKPKQAVYTLIAVIVMIAMVVGCTFTGAQQGSEMEKLSDEELIQLLHEEADSERIAQILTGFVEKTQRYNGEGYIRAYDPEGVWYGYGLNPSNLKAVQDLFSWYSWERVAENEPFSGEETSLELELAYADGVEVQILMQAHSLDQELLRVCWYTYDGNAYPMRGQDMCVFRSTPKEVGIPIYQALLDLFEEQETETGGIPDVTSVRVELEEEQEEPDFREVAHKILNDSKRADLILARTVSPTLAFDIGEEQIQSLLSLFENYTWDSESYGNSLQEGGYPIFLCGTGSGQMTFFDMAGYVCMTVYGDAPENAYSLMWKATPKVEGIKPLYDEIAEIYHNAILDDYFERSSVRIGVFLSDEILAMAQTAEISIHDPSAGKYELGEGNVETCAEMIGNYLWVEAVNDTYTSVYTQDQHTVLLEGNGRSIKYYSDQNLVKYICEDEVHYYYYIPVDSARANLVEEMVRIYDQLETAQ